MERLPDSDRAKVNAEHAYSQYEASGEDLRVLLEAIDTVYDSKLIDTSILDEIRFVTYDAHYLYICTRGTHTSTDAFAVEELPSSSKAGFKIFKIAHTGVVGNEGRDWRAAQAWFLCDQVESTAVGAQKYVYQVVTHENTPAQPQEILDVVRMAPYEPYTQNNTGDYNYLTDVVFHETAHIEHRHLVENSLAEFATPQERDRFLDLIKKTGLVPPWVLDILILHITPPCLREMYAMLIDREAARRYDTEQFGRATERFNAWRRTLTEEMKDATSVEIVVHAMSKPHRSGDLLVHILEEQIPNFEERKEFVQSVLRPDTRAQQEYVSE